ncbi:MAG: hypothetical protein R3E32_05395 [Chitinophagales bacterium]
MKKRHPYYLRWWWRQRLPWFLINIGIGDKGENCELANAEHVWYNIDNKTSGCYYCKKIAKEKLWLSE